ncbi:hypothetical protein HFO26_24470 [Rhizobium leguminosarum]|uniref:hypothetical protein n=1 Tax=Rhizobium leguminosarum TaxID=384 RepID=UPI001C975727|nr:hypothetical protein [Rhizobium leguminosarum]MBY5733410.1 hypothetical protein [Rhizobium leguminosarum]
MVDDKRKYKITEIGEAWRDAKSQVAAKPKEKVGCRAYVVAAVVFLIPIVLLSYCTAPSEEEERVKTQAGFHCLSSYSGALRSLESAVKERLRDPDSYEHIATRVTPVQRDGTHAVVMQFRARNGFGGMAVEQAKGRFRNADCELVEWEMQ